MWPSDHFSQVYTVKLACPLGTRFIDMGGKKVIINPKLSEELQDEEIQIMKDMNDLK